MTVHWHNLLALLLALIIVILTVTHWNAIGAFVGNMESIGPGHALDEQFRGLLALGFIAVCLVAIVRIITRDRNR